MRCWIEASEAVEERGGYSRRGLGVARCNWKETLRHCEAHP